MENHGKGREGEASLLTFVPREVLQPMEGGSDAFSKRLVSIKADDNPNSGNHNTVSSKRLLLINPLVAVFLLFSLSFSLSLSSGRSVQKELQTSKSEVRSKTK